PRTVPAGTSRRERPPGEGGCTLCSRWGSAGVARPASGGAGLQGGSPTPRGRSGGFRKLLLVAFLGLAVLLARRDQRQLDLVLDQRAQLAGFLRVGVEHRAEGEGHAAALERLELELLQG